MARPALDHWFSNRKEFEVVVAAAAEFDTGQEADVDHLQLGFADAALIVFLAQLGAILQCDVDQIADVGAQARHGKFARGGRRNLQMRSGGRIDEGCEFGFRERELAAHLDQIAHVGDELALRLQFVGRFADAALGGCFGAQDRTIEFGDGAVNFRHQIFGGDGAPVGVADVLHQVLDDLDAALFRNHHLVGFLLAAQICEAEIQDVPDDLKVEGVDALVLAGRDFERLVASDERAAGGSAEAVAGAPAGVASELRQEADFRMAQAIGRKLALERFQFLVEIEFDAACQRFVEIDGAAERGLIGVHGAEIGTDAICNSFLADRIEADAACQRECRHRRGAQKQATDGVETC